MQILEKSLVFFENLKFTFFSLLEKSRQCLFWTQFGNKTSIGIPISCHRFVSLIKFLIKYEFYRKMSIQENPLIVNDRFCNRFTIRNKLQEVLSKFTIRSHCRKFGFHLVKWTKSTMTLFEPLRVCRGRCHPT